MRIAALAVAFALVLPGLAAAGPAGLPEITTLSVDRSPLSGGVEVIAEGQNFTPDAQLTLGDAVVSSVTVESSSRLRFTVPRQQFAGGRTLTLRTAAGVAQRVFHVLPLRLEDIEAGQITSVAGGIPFLGDGDLATGDQVVLSALGVAVDSAGNMFVSDPRWNRVRRVDAKSGEITTYAGNGAAGYNGDGISAETASLYSPSGLAIDTDGALLIADRYNGRIRRVDPVTREISTVVESGDDFYYLPFDLAVDPDSGDVYFAEYYQSDYEDSLLRRFDRESGTVEFIDLGINSILGRMGIASDGEGGILIVLQNFGFIFRLDTDSGVVTMLYSGTGTYGAVDILAAGTSSCLIASDYEARINLLEYATGRITGVAGRGEGGFSGDGGPAVDAEFRDLQTIARDEAGNLFVADSGNARVRRIDTGGIVRTVAGNGRFSPRVQPGPATSVQLSAEYVAVDPEGNVFVPVDNRVYRIDATSGELSVVAGTGEAGFSGDGGPATEAKLSEPNGLAVESSGSLLIADSGNNRIRRVDAGTGAISTVAGGGTRPDGGPGTEVELVYPIAIARHGRASLFVTDFGVESTSQRVLRLNLKSGRIATVATVARPESSFGVPYAHMAVDRFGRPHLSGYSDIVRVNPDTGRSVRIAGGDTPGTRGDGGPARQAWFSPRGLAFDRNGHLYVSNLYFQIPPGDQFSCSIRRIHKGRKNVYMAAGKLNSFGEFSGDGGPAAGAGFTPAGLAFDDGPNLYIADRYNGHIRVIKGAGI
jgi:sugar lactone lactonase YvrE